jgi:putative spermidine/putrescine transport system substrate-binding protein
MAMRNDPTVDVIEVGGPTLGKSLAAGLLAPLDPAIVTNAADVLPAYRTPYVAHRLITPFALAFNTKYVDRATAQAKGWSLLLDPKLKGKVAIPKFGWQGETWMNAVNIAIGGSYDNFDPVVAMCRKIIQDNEGLVMESNDQGMSMYQDEEIVAAPFWTGRTYELQDKGLPLDFVYPPGWLTNGVGMAIVKGAPNPELAQRFANLSLDPAVQIALARRFFYLPTNRHAIEAVKDQPRLQIPEADIATAAQLDYGKMVLSADRNLERFNREVIG